MRFYLSGPMSGVPNYNYDLFNRVASTLRSDGVTEVINPAESFDGDSGLPRSTYIEWDMRQLVDGDIDVIVCLPGWEDAPGARLEVAMAYNLGKSIGEWQEMPPMVVSIPGSRLREVLKGYVPQFDPTGVAPEGKLKDFEEGLKVHTGDMFTCPYATTHEGMYHQPICEWCVDFVPGPHAPEKTITTPDPFNDDFSEGPDAEDMSYIPAQNNLDGDPSRDEDGSRIIDRAWGLVMGPRQSSYGHPAQDFETTGRMWGALLENWMRTHPESFTDGNDVNMLDIPPALVALMLACVKLSRESHAPKQDNRDDLIGYAICADRVQNGY